jgi:rod shape-determining protein MreD
MNKMIGRNIVRFLGLLLLQVLILNQITIFGYLSPMVYIVFVFLFPIRKNRTLLLMTSFLLGLTIDIFSNTGGINAAATLFIAYIRLPLLIAIMRKSDFDFLLFNLRSIAFTKAFTYIAMLTMIHHFIVFSLEYFSLNNFWIIISNTIFSSIFTIIISILGIILFTRKR